MAVVPVAILAFLVRGPLSRVPENRIKIVVGLLLTTFGTFWSIEGLGLFAPDQASLEWPFGDRSLAIILAGWIVTARILIVLLRRREPIGRRPRGRRGVRYVEAFLRFWYEFIVGDDWRIAAGVVAVLGVGAIVVGVGVTWSGLAVSLAIALVVVFALPMVASGRRGGR